MSVRPIGQGRGTKHGRCRLCGHVGDLSKTHVIAKGAGNDGEASFAVQRTGPDGVPILDLGSPRDGGGWGYWFCEPCNGKTGVWDEEFIKWQRLILRSIAQHRPETGMVLHLGLAGGDPGAFARCLWAWMFALDASLLDEEPDLATAVRDGSPVTPPERFRLLVAITTELSIWLANQRTGAAGVDFSGGENGWWQQANKLWTPEPPILELPPAVVAAPPFNVILADARHNHGRPHFDATSWVAEPARQHRDVAASLPVIRVTRPPMSPTPITYEQIVTASASALGDLHLGAKCGPGIYD